VVENKLGVFNEERSGAFRFSLRVMVVDDSRHGLHPHVEANGIFFRS